MGGCDFSNLVVIKGNAQDAYLQARQEMSYENGHQDGYSGDIQTTHGFDMRKDNPEYGTQAFEDWEEERLGEIYKGECECVEVTDVVPKRQKGVRTFYFFGVARC